jgi:hypothetical protein
MTVPGGGAGRIAFMTADRERNAGTQLRVAAAAAGAG